ncbi:septal ring lytic transglycosylase RlpA family protein [Litorimonas sp. RW-G-Af-16]|uniref:septal ring lytic transglycosylase RlpA family protein n=1 Tax=Litorimonas sp. RW-G-Af-16 TaxID=3241168 RepID=UPI003AB0CED5
MMGKQRVLLMGLLAATLSVSVSGCATTKVTKLTKAAPITYKVGKGNAQYASLAKPTLPRSKRPFSTPIPYEAPDAITRAPRAGKTFDQANVDPDLYKHQRVGKRYTVMGKSYTPKHEPKYDVTGQASYYGDKFHGKPTATGEIFNKNDITAAHKTLPLNSMLFVTNLENGKTLMVRLNDRGPFVGNRIIDLSEASARALGITKSQGLGKVRVQYAGPADPMAASRSVMKQEAQPVPFPEDNYVQAPSIATPAPAPSVPQYDTPQYEPPSLPAPVIPGRPQRLAPDAMPEDGGDVTLTIKGPIHVASYDSRVAEPRFIRGVVNTTK